MPDMHSTGLRVVGAWLFAIVLILFSTVFVHVPYTREIQMVLAIPVLLFFGAPFYAGAWKGTRSGRNNIDRLVALNHLCGFLFSVFNTSSRIIGWASGWNRMSIMGLPPSSMLFP